MFPPLRWICNPTLLDIKIFNLHTRFNYICFEAPLRRISNPTLLSIKIFNLQTPIQLDASN